MEKEVVINRVRTFLVDEFGLEDDLAAKECLFSTGLLDSLNSLQVLVFLETEMNIKISPLDVSLDDFDSLQQIADVVERLS